MANKKNTAKRNNNSKVTKKATNMLVPNEQPITVIFTNEETEDVVEVPVTDDFLKPGEVLEPFKAKTAEPKKTLWARIKRLFSKK